MGTTIRSPQASQTYEASSAARGRGLRFFAMSCAAIGLARKSGPYAKAKAAASTATSSTMLTTPATRRQQWLTSCFS